MAGMSLDRLGGILIDVLVSRGCPFWFPDGDASRGWTPDRTTSDERPRLSGIDRRTMYG